MLHNTGPYGPNETPINVGTGVNMNQISGHMNLAHNINNLSKITHQTPPGPSGHYNLPEYGHYDPSVLGMPPQMSSYPNYQHLGFQPNYMTPNSGHYNDLPWQNSMFPMNMNIQSDHTPNMINYPFDKRIAESMRNDQIKEQNIRPMPLNIPQIPNRQLNKPMSAPEYYHEKQERSNNYVQNNINQNSNQNLDLTISQQERMKFDSRRKNIENTVRLIEDILIHSSNKPKNIPKPDIVYNNLSEYDDSSQESIVENLTMPKQTKQDVNPIPKPTTIYETKKPIVNNDPLSLTNEKIDKRNSINDKPVKSPDNTNDVIVKPNEDPLLDTDSKSLVNTDTESSDVALTKVDIKVEDTSWSYHDYLQPFLKDVNGFRQEDKHYDRIIDPETSINDAIAAVRLEIKQEGYFECPHCTLLFTHPKRFLIHVKWHSFGLTNEKRLEQAREKEQKRFERKEAKLLERMNSKEVSEGDSSSKSFVCKDCDKVFPTKSTLRTHRQRDHPTRIRDCKICHKTVVGWMALRAHLNTHAVENGYQCSDCPKRFKYAHSLAKHSDTHLEKIHGCQECPKKFGSQKLLKMHMKTHERQQRGTTFRCSYCGKGFFESYNLQVHERTHRNERPFLCEICNTSYGTNSSLKRHLKVSHSTDKPYECSVCHRNFSTEPIRDRHEQRLHGNPEDFKFPCKLCDCKYLKHKDLQKHVYKAHPKGKRKKKGSKSDSE